MRLSKYTKSNKERKIKGEIMRMILIIAAIILLAVGILGLFPQFGWANVPLWRAILEIVVGGLVLIIGIRRR
jgi:hypothetical protein